MQSRRLHRSCKILAEVVGIKAEVSKFKKETKVKGGKVMKKRVFVIKREDNFDAYLEDMDTRKIVCRESGTTIFEALGALVAFHEKEFDLYEVTEIVNISR